LSTSTALISFLLLLLLNDDIVWRRCSGLAMKLDDDCDDDDERQALENKAFYSDVDWGVLRSLFL
jgi:hypothetical protein